MAVERARGVRPADGGANGSGGSANFAAQAPPPSAAASTAASTAASSARSASPATTRSSTAASTANGAGTPLRGCDANASPAASPRQASRSLPTLPPFAAALAALGADLERRSSGLGPTASAEGVSATRGATRRLQRPSFSSYAADTPLPTTTTTTQAVGAIVASVSVSTANAAHDTDIAACVPLESAACNPTAVEIIGVAGATLPGSRDSERTATAIDAPILALGTTDSIQTGFFAAPDTPSTPDIDVYLGVQGPSTLTLEGNNDDTTTPEHNNRNGLGALSSPQLPPPPLGVAPHRRTRTMSLQHGFAAGPSQRHAASGPAPAPSAASRALRRHSLWCDKVAQQYPDRSTAVITDASISPATTCVSAMSGTPYGRRRYQSAYETRSQLWSDASSGVDAMLTTTTPLLPDEHTSAIADDKLRAEEWLLSAAQRGSVGTAQMCPLSLDTSPQGPLSCVRDSDVSPSAAMDFDITTELAMNFIHNCKYPLHEACKRGNVVLANRILALDKMNATKRHSSSDAQHVVKLIDSLDDDGNTPLRHAVLSGSLPTVLLLLAKGCKIPKESEFAFDKESIIAMRSKIQEMKTKRRMKLRSLAASARKVADQYTMDTGVTDQMMDAQLQSNHHQVDVDDIRFLLTQFKLCRGVDARDLTSRLLQVKMLQDVEQNTEDGEENRDNFEEKTLLQDTTHGGVKLDDDIDNMVNQVDQLVSLLSICD